MTAFRSIQMGLSMSVWMSACLFQDNSEMNSEEAITQATENYNQVVKEKGETVKKPVKPLSKLKKHSGIIKQPQL